MVLPSFAQTFKVLGLSWLKSYSTTPFVLIILVSFYKILLLFTVRSTEYLDLNEVENFSSIFCIISSDGSVRTQPFSSINNSCINEI